MQVATLFRETATLLGASMETGGVGVNDGSGQMNAGPGTGPNLGPGSGPGHVLGFDHFNHPNSNKFKLNMKLEPHDDGYETSADIIMSNATNHDSLKCDSMEDPYSFIDEDPMQEIQGSQQFPHCVPSITVPHPHVALPAPKKRGRKKKIHNEQPGLEYDLGMNRNVTIATPKAKERKKHDRFNGMPEEEVSKRTLPDHLATNLDIIIIGINPGLFAAYKGHHYAGPGNHFWKCLYLSGLTPEQMTADEDFKLLQVGIGFTNMVQRPTKGSADLTRKEIKEGCQILLEKLQRFKPKIAVFNGKLIYEVFSGKKDFSFGRQPDLVDGTNTYMWVMPSSSARCAQLPRAADKVPFYAALKKFRDYLNGIVTNIDDSEVVFSDSRLKSCCESESKAEALYSMDLMDISNAIVKREEVLPCKKKRGRPKKIKVEGEEIKPVVRKVAQSQNVNNCDFPKKKRGRPKKNKCEEIDVSLHERNTRTPITKCFSSPSPLHSPSFCHIGGPMSVANGNNASMYNNTNSISLGASHVQYSQSPRPHSQPFTHSDLSSEISAAISSDHLGSPAPTSPSLGPPDFDPPTSMPIDDATAECGFSSPTHSNASEQPAQNTSAPTPYPASYQTFGLNEDDGHRFGPGPGSGSGPIPVPVSVSNGVSDYKVQDMSSKSLSGLESLVDQIPSIADGESATHGASNPGLNMSDGGDHYGSSVYPDYGGSRSPGSSPIAQTTYNYSSNYGSLSVTSLTGAPGTSPSTPFSVNNYHETPPPLSPTGSYHQHQHLHQLMGQTHSFIDHPGCPVPLSPYTQLPPPPSPYGHQQFSSGISYPSASSLHMSNSNYSQGPPPPYYNTGYPPSQVGSPNSTSPSYLHPHGHHHMFDRIKSDIGYGSF